MGAVNSTHLFFYGNHCSRTTKGSKEKVRLHFGALDEFRMEGDYTDGYIGHGDHLIMLALGYDQKRFTACLSFPELDVQIQAKYFEWCRLP